MEKQFRIQPVSTVYRNGDSQFPGGTDDLTQLLTFNNVRAGFANHGWAKRIEAGQFVASPYTVDRVDIRRYQSTAWSIEHKTLETDGSIKTGSTRIYGMPNAPGSFGIPTNPYLESERLKAISDANSILLSKIREEHSEANGLLMLGELRETIKMVRRPAGALKDAFALFTSSAKREAALARTRRAFTKAYTGLYLEWAYGWKPLASDIGDLSSTLVRHLTEPPPRKRVTGASQPLVKTSNSESYKQSSSPDSLSLLSQVNHQSLSALGTAYLKPTFSGPDGSARRLVELAGFSLENFVPTVYNLIPYSFLIDYVSNLGDVIEGACTVQSSVQGVVMTSRMKSTSVYTISRPTARAQAAMKQSKPRISEITETCPPAELILDRTVLNRTLSSQVGVPDLYLHLPGGRQSFNMLALIQGFAANVRPPRR